MSSLKSESKYKAIRIVRELETAIKLNCYDCMGHQKKVDCELDTCTLYPFRPWAKTKTKKE